MESGARQLTSTDIAEVTPVKMETYGALGSSKDGRRFRYVRFGGNLSPGQIAVAPALVANHQNIAVAAAAVAGANSLQVTLGASAVTQDQYAGGHMTVGVDGSGNPIVRRLKGNTAGASGATITVLLNNAEPLLFPLTTSNVVSLAPSLYSGVTASSTAGLPMGVVVTGGTSGQFGWIQTFGPAAVINDAAATLAALARIKQSTTVAGAVVVSAAAGAIELGHMVQSATASKAGLAMLTLD